MANADHVGAVRKTAQGLQPDLVRLRRDLHAHPETGLKLPRTQAAVLDALSGLDLEVSQGQALRNLDKVLQAAGSGLSHIAKVTILVTDLTVIDQVIALRREFFTEPYPADTIAQVASLAQGDWEIEIEAIAVVPA